MNETLSLPRKEKLFLLGLFLFSFLLRLIYLLQVKSNPFFYNLSLDPLFHDLWAQAVASGDWVGQGVFFRAPFYPYFLGLIYKVIGHDLLVVRLIQHIIGSVSVVLVYLLARRLFGRRTAFISGILASTYWIFIYFEGELLLDFLLVFLDVLLILLLYRAADRPGFRNWFGAGIILGFSAITRPNILIFVPFILLWLFIRFHSQKSKLFCLRSWAFVCLGAGLVILPVTIRNYLVGRDFVFIASQGGINFFIGNNPHADGTSAVVPGLGDDWDYTDAVVLAEQELGRELKPSQASNYFYKRGWDFIVEEPSKSIPLLLKKVYLVWNQFEVSNNQNTYFFQRYSSLLRILPIGFWLVGPLSVLGIWLAFKNLKKCSLILFFVFSYLFTIVFFFVADRFRLPVIPFLVILASWALVFLWENVKIRNYSALIFPATLLAIAFWFCNSNFYNLSKSNFAQSFFSLGNVYLKQNQPEKAEAYYDSALAMNENLPRARLNLGIIQLRRGELDRAGAEFATVLALNPYEEKAYNNLSTVYRLKGELRKAAQFASAAIQLRPNYGTAYSNLGLAYQALNQPDSAISVLQTGVGLLPDDIQLRYYLGELYLRLQNQEPAEQEFSRVLSSPSRVDIETYDISGFGQAQAQSQSRLKAQAAYYLGLMKISREDWTQAERFFRLALELKPDLAEAYGNLGKLAEMKGNLNAAVELHSRAIQLSPKSPLHYYNRAATYLNLGQTELAGQDLESALQLDPEFDPARKLLKEIGKK